MKIRLIDFGVTKERCPFRPHENDAGADVFMPFDCRIKPGEIIKIPLGYGIEIPDGFAGYVFPRSSMALKGLICELYITVKMYPCSGGTDTGSPEL